MPINVPGILVPFHKIFAILTSQHYGKLVIAARYLTKIIAFANPYIVALVSQSFDTPHSSRRTRVSPRFEAISRLSDSPSAITS
ncbi:hypothetical protein H0H81_006335 [Sphagnurus paluster]|uniref:Uncharacterized protein n=1 Tax=Sphagnurus paluster TaxID=117069 RepID=A0A9P7FRE0_9AGAR|nr:hypothetical protein H0H81_006335 [Sphagnurus paluster]